jgi:hypothetical protein
MGIAISQIRSLQIDTWNDIQLLYLSKGGNNNFNKNLSEFNIDSSSVSLEVKYKSKAADYYRRYLKNEVDKESDAKYVPTQIIKPELYEAQEILEIEEENKEENQNLNKKEEKNEKKSFFGIMRSVLNKVKDSTTSAVKSVEKGFNDYKIGEKLKVAGNAITGAAKTSGNFIADKTQKAVNSEFVQNITKKTKEGVNTIVEKTKSAISKDNKNKEEEFRTEITVKRDENKEENEEINKEENKEESKEEKKEEVKENEENREKGNKDEEIKDSENNTLIQENIPENIGNVTEEKVEGSSEH